MKRRSGVICCLILQWKSKVLHFENLKATGHEIANLTVSLTATADGAKKKPFSVFKGAKKETKLLNEVFHSRCIVASTSFVTGQYV